METHINILVLIDAFTKFIILHPTKTVGATETVRELRKTFGIFGCPRRLISDRGKAFDSKIFREYMVERVNRTLTEAIIASIEDEASWDEVLPRVAWGINNSIYATTRQIPSDLMFAYFGGAVYGDMLARRQGGALKGGKRQNPFGGGQGTDQQGVPGGNTDDDVKARRLQAKRRLDMQGRIMKNRFDNRRKQPTVYKRGDLVLWQEGSTSTSTQGTNSKLTRRFNGPYKVIKVLGNGRYIITAVKGARGYKNRQFPLAVDALRKYSSSVAIESQQKESEKEQMTTDDLLDELESK